ncbi:MAG TPA: hypothetical protein DCE41_21960 [Cytophagales bacterium]|nr:hypothetical protein [Cytophagales bacterium]HAA19272.1 hypothetical protein [Cytophagales bacterium]HAP58813.1 hypothetical protein [Cytophagales bacterium]
MISFLKEVFGHFLKSNTFQKGAALAYYAVFSILPTFVIITSVLGIFFGEQAVSGELQSQLEDVLGQRAALEIQNFIKNQHKNYNNVLTSILGFVTLALSASGMLVQVHNAFNSIWNIKPRPGKGLLRLLTRHLTSLLLLIGLFFLLILSTLTHSLLIRYAGALQPDHQFLYLLEHGTSLVLLSIIIAFTFKFLGDAKIHWKALVWSGTVTAVLLTLGKTGIGYYLGSKHIDSTFGSASVLALLMLWVYYTSQILFLGASLVEVISQRIGHPLQPKAHAMKVETQEVKEK